MHEDKDLKTSLNRCIRFIRAIMIKGFNTPIGRFLMRIRRRLVTRSYELVNRWKTEEIYEIPRSILQRAPDAFRYEPTLYQDLPVILPYISHDDVFVDLGCGKGRVICFVASRCKIRKVIGVEIVPELVRIARQNAAKSKLLTPLEVIEADVASVKLGDATIYYMANPFGEKTLRRLLKNISESLHTYPRKIRIIYMYAPNPNAASIIDQVPWLVPEVHGRLNHGRELGLGVWHN